MRDPVSHISIYCSPLSMHFHSRDQRWSPVEIWLVSPADHGPRPTKHLTSDICLPSPLDASIDKHTLKLTHDARLLQFMAKTDRKAADIFTVCWEEWCFVSLQFYSGPFISRRLECSKRMKNANDKCNLLDIQYTNSFIFGCFSQGYTDHSRSFLFLFFSWYILP